MRVDAHITCEHICMAVLPFFTDRTLTLYHCRVRDDDKGLPVGVPLEDLGVIAGRLIDAAPSA
jgi:hypothetical protein